MSPLDVLRAMEVGFEAGSTFDPRRPTLVMVHGAGSRGEMWLNQVVALRHALNTLALDLPGHGATAGPSRTSIPEYAHWLMTVIRSAFPGGVVLMGHSMGGAIVQRVVLDGLEVEGLVLVGTGCRLKVAPAFLEGLTGDFEHTVDEIIRWAYAPGTSAAVLREGALYMKAAPPAVVLGDFEACSRFDIRDEVGRVQRPCLIVCGEQDKLAPPKLSQELAQKITGSQLALILNAGHMVMIEERGAFNSAVKGFVETVGRKMASGARPL